ncbi:family 43 glycosylhydrolase [Alteromonadaceae bacterium BrNp21-10]|nr:family 43 glycosylhydrolase [Alteromonadaceae bacterium BrNp21-10]
MHHRQIIKNWLTTCLLCAGASALPAISAELKIESLEVDGQQLQSSKVISGQDEAVYNLDFEQASFQLEAQVKLSDLDSNLGIRFRHNINDASSGYSTGIDGQQHVYLQTTNKVITQKGAAVSAKHWYNLKLQVQNNHFVLYVDDQLIHADSFPQYDAIDNQFSAGGLGFYAQGTGGHIKNIHISQYNQPIQQLTYTNPVQLNCADPGLLQFESTYYAYCTYTPDFPMMKRGIRLYTSKDLVNWQDRGFALKNADSWGTSRHWAPDVVEKNGTFYMYYAVDERIAVATATSPLGPFVQQKQVPMQPDSIKIDAHVFKDDNGKQYFYYVGFDNGNHIWGAELNDDMHTVKTDTMTHLIAPVESWETDMANVAEGPVVIKHKGLYYMTYSGSHFESPHYSIGYAVAEHPLGPWKKYQHNPIMKSTTFSHGTAHHSLAKSPDGQEMFVVYHQHYSLNQTEPRKIAIDRIRFVPQENGPDILQTWGPTVTPQPLPSGVVSH